MATGPAHLQRLHRAQPDLHRPHRQVVPALQLQLRVRARARARAESLSPPRPTRAADSVSGSGALALKSPAAALSAAAALSVISFCASSSWALMPGRGVWPGLRQLEAWVVSWSSSSDERRDIAPADVAALCWATVAGPTRWVLLRGRLFLLRGLPASVPEAESDDMRAPPAPAASASAAAGALTPRTQTTDVLRQRALVQPSVPCVASRRMAECGVEGQRTGRSAVGQAHG